MSRNIIGILVAVMLAGIGTVALVAYVGQAEERARSGEELVEVYVVQSPIPVGTAGSELASMVEISQVPAKVRAQNHVINLAAVEDLVTAVELVPGEQLLANRFMPRADLVNRSVGVVVPNDALEITVTLEPHRVVGGLVEAGDTVAVFASFEPFDVLPGAVVEVDGQEVVVPDAVSSDGGSKSPNTTDLMLQKVLVTAVQQDTAAAGMRSDDGERDVLTEAPAGNLLVTLALPPAEAERIVFTAEFGTLWLGIERSTVPELDNPIQTRASIYQDPVSPAATPLASTVGS